MNGKPYRLTWYQKVYDLIRFGPMAVRQYLRDRKEVQRWQDGNGTNQSRGNK